MINFCFLFQGRGNYWKELEPPHGVNETLWAAVVEAAFKSPFQWTKLSRALGKPQKTSWKMAIPLITPPLTRNIFPEGLIASFV